MNRPAEKYFHQGMRVLISGRIQTGSYTNREGQKVYTTEVIIDDQEFADSKGASSNGGGFSVFCSNSEIKKEGGLPVKSLPLSSVV